MVYYDESILLTLAKAIGVSVKVSKEYENGNRAKPMVHLDKNLV